MPCPRLPTPLTDPRIFRSSDADALAFALTTSNQHPPRSRFAPLDPPHHFPFSLFHFPLYSIPMPEHIEDIQRRYIDLKKRMELVRSYL
jgi:hypothetical protein